MRALFVFLFCIASPLCVANNEAESIAEPDPLQNTVPSAESLLTSLSTVLHLTSYSGEITYEHGSQLESFRVEHSVNGDEERDTLYRLTGREQEFVRSGPADCGTIGGYLLGGRRLSSSDGKYFGLDRYYHPTVLGKDRVAGRYAWVVQLVPKDEYRFGINLAIDVETNLLMQYVIFDARKKIALERMQFVSLTLGDAKTDGLEQTVETINVTEQRCVGSTYLPDGHSPWKPTWLPPGFLLTGSSYTEKDGHMETYTDGVSAFSVFVKESVIKSETATRVQPGVSARGALMALMTMLPFEEGPVNVTVIGEIPLSAAQKISLSVRKISTEQKDG